MPGFRVLLAGLFAGMALLLPNASLAAGLDQRPPPPCQYVLGFATLRALIPAVVGLCLEDEYFDPTSGDSLQHTTNGLLVWRKLDNWTAFTDGYHTWVNGPYGVQERLNDQRFCWEANPDLLPIVGGGPGCAQAGTGVDGQVTLGPIQPVCPVGLPCSQPVAAEISIQDGAGQEVQLVASGADGHFRVDLAPGTYQLVPLPLASNPGAQGRPQTATVQQGTYTHVTITYDTGLR